MTTSQYGVDLWPGAWESLQGVGNLNRMIEWDGENQRERGWCKVYGLAVGDGSRDLCVTDRGALAQLMVVDATLQAIQVELGTLPASGTSVVEIYDAALVLGVNVYVYTPWIDITKYDSIALWVQNTGANQIDNLSHQFASDAAGADLTTPAVLTALVIAAGAMDARSSFTSTATAVPNTSTGIGRYPFRGIRFGIKSVAGSACRVIVTARKPWARD